MVTNEGPSAVAELLRTLERQQFYGSLEIKFEAGRVVLLRKTETIKLTGGGGVVCQVGGTK